MKSLVESLFDTNIIQKKVAMTLLDVIKGHLKYIALPDGVPIHKYFDVDGLKKLKEKYSDVVLPTKRFASAYNRFSILNTFLNFLLDNIIVTREINDIDDSCVLNTNTLNTELKKLTKVVVSVTGYKRPADNNNTHIVFKIVGQGSGIKTIHMIIENRAFENLMVDESLFDSDLIQKEVLGHQLKDIVFFDGQWVYRIGTKTRIIVSDGGILIRDGIKGMNVLEVIDWKKVKQDLKKWGGEDIDLGLYAYANSNKFIMRTTETNKKTEDFARLIMSIPCVEEYNFGSYNSRFRDEFEKKLREYILPQWRDGFYWKVDCTSKYGLSISLRYEKTGSSEWLRFEFVKNSD